MKPKKVNPNLQLLVSHGSALKALTTPGKVGGYLMLWSDASRKDVTGTFFTRHTEYEWQGKETRPALYHHGLDPQLGQKRIGNGWELKRADDVGLWVETQLDLRDHYEAAIYQLTKAGKLGLSSGTAEHLIETKSSGEITRWPLVEGSFTPTPADWNTAVVPLKSVNVVPFKSLLEKGKNNMNLLDKIKQLVPGLSDEQYAQIGAVLDLAMGMDGETENTPDPSTDPANVTPTDAAIKSAVMEVLKSMDISPKKAIAPVTRPPYQMASAASQPDPESDEKKALKSISVTRFGETDSGIKAIASDLYGADYDVARYQQMQAFNRYARTGKVDAEGERYLKTVILTPKQVKSALMNGISVRELKADLSEAVDSLGGLLVPEDLRLDMLERLPGLTAIRAGADVVSTSSDVMSRVKVTGGNSRYTNGMRVTWVGDKPADGDAKTAPSFGVEKTPVHIVMCTSYVPKALLEDSAFPLANKIGEWSSQAFSMDEDEQFLIGNGISKPQGILPNSLNAHSLAEVKSGHASQLTVSGLVNLRYGINRQYRNGAVWIMNDKTAGVIAAMVDGQNRPLWQPSMTEGEPDRLLGYPVITTEVMPDIAANAFPILFGNRRGYKIADRIGMSLVRDEITLAEQDLTRFIFRRRLGGQLGEEWAFAVQKVTA